MEISYIRYAGTGEPLCIDGEVALVGNSDLLLKTEYGKEIDAHKHIFRFNLPLIGGDLSKHVGQRYDYFLLSGGVVHGLRKMEIEKRQRFKKICKAGKIICYPNLAFRITGAQHPVCEMNISPSRINKILTRRTGSETLLFNDHTSPRNGIKLIACLIDAGIKPVLFGFDICDRSHNVHYFDDEKQNETPQNEFGHRPSVEYKLLSELAERDLITLNT